MHRFQQKSQLYFKQVMKAFLREKGNNSLSNKQNRDSNLLYNFQKKLRLNQNQPHFKKRKEKDAFVQRVNGYIQTISNQNKVSKNSNPTKKQLFQAQPRKPQKSQSRKSSKSKVNSLSKKLKAQKQINKNLQKCIIQIQKILWERNQRLDALQTELSSASNLLSRQSYEEQEQASEQSCKRIASTEGDLKRYANSVGLKKFLNNMNNGQIEQASQSSDTKNNGSQSSCSMDYQKPYIKIERPRTQSQSQISSKRRK